MKRALLASLLCTAQALAQDGGVPGALAGVWKLDAQASSDPAALLEHADADFLTRSFATSVRPTNRIAWQGDRFTLEVKAVTVTKNSTIVLDGKTPTSDDLFGSPYQYTSVLEGGAVVSRGEVRFRNGTTDTLAMRRTLEADGSMVLTTTLTAPDGKVFGVKRVFRRQAR